MSDQKIKQASDKCPLDLIPLASLKGPARVYGYGAKKYAAGNYYTADDDQIVQRYAGAALRHLASCQNPNGLYDMKSIAAIDPESGLPEIDHAICGLLMLRALATKHGALPADPGVGVDPRAQASSASLIDARVAAGAVDVAVEVRDLPADPLTSPSSWTPVPLADPPIGSRVRVVKSTWHHFDQRRIGRTGILRRIDRNVLPVNSCFFVKLDMDELDMDPYAGDWVDQIEVVS